MSFNTSTWKRDDVSLKLRSTNLRNAQDNTRKLEVDNRKMEERLNELKMAMSREKEERDTSQGGFWKTGQTGTLNDYAKEVVHKPNKPKNPKQRKIKVLKEEITVAPPPRNKGPGTMAHIAQRSTGGSTGKENKVKGPRCGQCEDKGAQVSCVECGEDYCAPCFASFHLKGALKKHRSIPFGSSGPRTPRGVVTPRQGQSLQQNKSKSPGTHQMEALPKKQQITEEVRPMKVTLTEIDIDIKADAHPSQNGGPSLLEGDYNEVDSAAAFQEALKAWRTPAAPGASPERKMAAVSPVKSPIVNTESSTSTDLPSAGTPEIKFTASLTYAERLLLKKHRRTELEPVPDTLGQARSKSTSGEDNNHNYVVMSSNSAPVLSESPEETPVEVLQELRRTNEDGIQWRDIHRAMKEDSTIADDWRSDSRVSIIELENDDTVVKTNRRRKAGDERTAYHVTEVGREADQELLSSRKQSASRPPSVGSTSKRNRASEATPGANPSNQINLQKQKSSLKSSPSKNKPDTKTDLNLDLEQVKGQGQASNPKSARPKSSRKGPSRPQSRAMSRAETRMALFGEGELTKAPSQALQEIARMTPRSEQTPFVPTMADFFTGGFVTPEDVKERVMTPRSTKAKDAQKDAGIPKWKISYNLYNMGPRSWKPTSSLQETVSDADVTQTIDITAPYLREVTPAQPEDRLIQTVSYSIAEGVTHSRTGDREDTGLLSSDLAKVHNKRSASDRGVSPSSSTTLTPRPETTTPRPLSRAIVVDGDDLTSYDQNLEKQEQNDEDEEALYQLEWELASHDGRVSADGKMSRLSRMSPDLDGTPEPTGPELANLAMLNDGRPPSPGASYDTRVEDLMDDFEEMEKQMLDEAAVKALH